MHTWFYTMCEFRLEGCAQRDLQGVLNELLAANDDSGAWKQAEGGDDAVHDSRLCGSATRGHG